MEIETVVVLKHDGIERTYRCDNWYDAVVLFEALSRGMPRARIEMWSGPTLKQEYNV